jgi:hypothetical protein
MNTLHLSHRLLSSEVIDGIEFDGCVAVELHIDQVNVCTGSLSSCLPVMDELKKSAGSDGCFLIVTCACGVADDAGLSGIEVTHTSGKINWCGDGIEAVFDADEYRAEINRFESVLEEVREIYTLEPRTVVYPEDWKKDNKSTKKD